MYVRNRNAGICDSLSTAKLFPSSYDSTILLVVSCELVVGSKYLLKSIALLLGSVIGSAIGSAIGLLIC